jgi:hypothetical protein
LEDQIQRARLRFMNMLENAEVAAAWAAKDPPPSGVQPSSLMLAATKAMNRAGGFLEAISILFPDLGAELLYEFESFASKVDSLSIGTHADGERRIIPGARRHDDDRRAWNRRLSPDRRRHSMEMAVERRYAVDRRAERDRRNGKIREFADRRWRAVQS